MRSLSRGSCRVGDPFLFWLLTGGVWLIVWCPGVLLLMSYHHSDVTCFSSLWNQHRFCCDPLSLWSEKSSGYWRKGTTVWVFFLIVSALIYSDLSFIWKAASWAGERASKLGFRCVVQVFTAFYQIKVIKRGQKQITTAVEGKQKCLKLTKVAREFLVSFLSFLFGLTSVDPAAARISRCL